MDFNNGGDWNNQNNNNGWNNQNNTGWNNNQSGGNGWNNGGNGNNWGGWQNQTPRTHGVPLHLQPHFLKLPFFERQAVAAAG